MNWPPNPGNRVELFALRGFLVAIAPLSHFCLAIPKKVWRWPRGWVRIKQLLSRAPMRPTDGLGCSDLPFG